MQWKHLNGTGERRPKGAAYWLEFHAKLSGDKPGKCSKKGCSNPATLGAHVKKVKQRKNQDNSWYIVPMCDSCNQTKKLVFELNVSVNPVEVNRRGLNRKKKGR